MAFTPRLSSAGLQSSKYYNTAPNGYNNCIRINGTFVCPNCVGYAYGRFMECAGITSCNLPTSNAGRWWYDVGANYPKGQTPQLGAVGCYVDNTGGAGHVLIVEQVNLDGSFVTSESAYGGQLFITQTLRPPYYAWSSHYSLQGFIYNTHLKNVSGSDVAAEFVKTAKAQIGSKLSWTKSVAHCDNIKWSAAFVCACAIKAGDVLDKVIAKSFNQEEMFRLGVEKKYGTFISGPQLGAAPKPRAGDLIAFRDKKKSGGSRYAGDRVGIVVEVVDNTISVVSGDTNSTSIHLSVVSAQKYAINTNTILGYFRPQWSLLNSSVLDLPNNGLYTSAQLYTTQNTSEDAVIREVGYLDSKYKPSIQSSDIRLSVVNYTDLLSAFVSHLSVTPSVIDEGVSNYNVVADGVVNNAAKTVIKYFTNKGLNAAAAVAIAANINGESGFNTAALGDYGTAFGLCQWRFNRATQMKSMAGNNWANNFNGQLDYLWYELTTSYTNTYNFLRNVDNTLDGAYAAVGYFVKDFERPRDPAGETSKRQEYAREYWQQIVIQKV